MCSKCEECEVVEMDMEFELDLYLKGEVWAVGVGDGVSEWL